MKLIPFTHKGWFGLCPIYAAEVDSESPYIEPRLPYTAWLLEFSAWFFGLLNADAFPITFTGELTPPKMIDVDHE